MLRFTARVLLLPFTIAAWGCNDPAQRLNFSTPPAPSPPPAPAPAPDVTLRLTGRVLDAANVPVPAAAVAVASDGGGAVAISDAAGFFSVTFQSRFNGMSIATRKSGYETTESFISLGAQAELSHNIRLHPILRTPAGSAIRLTLHPDDSFCGFDFEYRCRIVRVTTAAAGVLVVEAVADRAGAAVGVGRADEFTMLRPRLTIDVPANAETPVLVLTPWQLPAPEALTLTSSLQ